MWPDFMPGDPEKERKNDLFSFNHFPDYDRNDRSRLHDNMTDEELTDYFKNLPDDERDRIREESGMPKIWAKGDKKPKKEKDKSKKNKFKPGEDGEHGTLSDFVERYKGKTFEEISTENGRAKYDYPNGPILNYVEDPLNPGKYIDMTHMLIVGKEGPLIATALEINQFIGNSPSAFKSQDLWSNKLGYAFWSIFRQTITSNPTKFVECLDFF